jgi:hypothetical protein
MVDPARTGRQTRAPLRRLTIAPLAALTIILGQAGATPAAGPVAKVDHLEGRASVTRKQARRPLALDYSLHLQDVVLTASGSRLGLLFVDNTHLQVAEDTRLVITTFLFDPQKKVRRLYLRMVAGAVKFTTSRLMGFKDKRFQIKTHTATVGARGTSAIVLAGRTGPGPSAAEPRGPRTGPYRIASRRPVAPARLARARPRGYIGPYTMVYNASLGPHLVKVVLNAVPSQRRTLGPGDIVWVYERSFGPVRRATRRQRRRLNKRFGFMKSAGTRRNLIQADDLPDMVRSRVPGTWRRRLILLRYLNSIDCSLGLNGGPGSTYNYGGWVYRPLLSRWSRNAPSATTARHGR